MRSEGTSVRVRDVSETTAARAGDAVAALPRRRLVDRVCSGGQTGVDRSALDAALSLDIPVGGWCPRGRRAEDGTIPEFYPLVETASARYAQRTEWNVRDSDGTLILTCGPCTGGTSLTAKLARQYERPLHIVDLSRPAAFGAACVGGFQRWLAEHAITTLNIAGPRASSAPAIVEKTLRWLQRALRPHDADDGRFASGRDGT